MFDMQKLVNSMAAMGMKDRSNYHATFGDLIDKLRQADDSAVLSPAIEGIGAYRGYYSDIALCTDGGNSAYKEEMDYDNTPKDFGKWYKENEVEIDFTGTSKELAEKLESIIGMYFYGYKGGYNKITREKPLWVATDYSDCSDLAVIEITDDLKLITKTID